MAESVDLLALDRQKRIAFCLACCERLLPAYLRFCSEASFGNPGYIRALLDDLWNAMVDGTSTAARFAAAIEAMGNLAPDTDEHSTVVAAAALNLVAAIANTLEYISHDDIDSLLSVPNQVTDAVDSWIMDSATDGITTENDEPYVRAHALYQREENRQIDDYYLLMTSGSLTSEVIHQVRAASSYDALAFK